MCGIAGAVVPTGETPSFETLGAMGEALAHRGPDDAQVRCYGRAGLSFRRLSIIDRASGAQPIDNEDGSVHVVLNGEIYNHLELREELERKGHRFRTRSDVETVVHGYEEFGDSVVERLRGMFALAIWDEPGQRLLLARDRLGKKPLVYHEAAGRLVFASELRALMCDPVVPRRPDLVALHHYLTFQYVPAPATAFEGVRKLAPGHLLVYQNGETRTTPYWSLPFRPPLRLDRREAAAEILARLREAVRVRLMSEVPLGAFLSGGLDSSAVVALMSETGRVKTFSIGFEEQGFDELPFARLVARHCGTDHHEFVVRPHAAEVLPQLVEHYGEPFADSSALPTYYLSKVTSDHVTVALNGDGGDELFAGYDRHKLLAPFAAAARVPGLVPLSRALADRIGDRASVRVRRLLGAVSVQPELSYARTVSCFAPAQKLAVFSDEMRALVAGQDSYRLLLDRFAECDAPDLLGRALYVDTMTYLPGDLLVKVDIATMIHSLEARSPFLDHPLVEFAARLPSRLKLDWRGGKAILREAVAPLLPVEILRRRKKGFGVPIARWFRGELRELLGDVVLSPRAAARPFFRKEVIRRLCADHWEGRADLSPQLWALLMLELWCRRFLDQAP